MHIDKKFSWNTNNLCYGNVEFYDTISVCSNDFRQFYLIYDMLVMFDMV